VSRVQALGDGLENDASVTGGARLRSRVRRGGTITITIRIKIRDRMTMRNTMRMRNPMRTTAVTFVSV
jgi:hypothetical protein